ncbi:MAG TPA: hypothetical protein VK601_08155, partial [Kofleriaceae bacterium]|nr:hypothetical protein [Kofleriaceae bacterium]
LRAKDALALFPTVEDHSLLVHKFARQITVDHSELPITPLLVSIFVSQAVQAAAAPRPNGLAELPESIPEVYFSYVEQLDATRRAAGDPQDRPDLARHAAAVIAFAELGDDYRPKPVSLQAVARELEASLGNKLDYVARMEACGLIVRRVRGTDAFIEYMLDPVAECLGAHEHARRCGTDPGKWQDLIAKVAARGDASRGFLTALRMNHAAYGDAMQFPPVAFPGDGDPVRAPDAAAG